MNNKNGILIYEDKDGLTRVDVKFIDEDVWLNKYQLADIYKTTRQNIEQHINNIYEDKELLSQLARISYKFKKRVIEVLKEI